MQAPGPCQLDPGRISAAPAIDRESGAKKHHVELLVSIALDLPPFDSQHARLIQLQGRRPVPSVSDAKIMTLQ